MAAALHIPRRHSPEQVDALFVKQREEDRVGRAIHLVTALGACFFAGWPTTFVEWAGLPVLVCFLIRMTGWHRMLEPLAFDRLLRLLLAWGAWAALSLVWSAGRHDPVTGAASRAWVMDVEMLRYLALAVILWPVLDRRTWLIGALMAGILCGEASQLVHLIGPRLGWEPWHRAAGRFSGWWDPAVSGTILCAGLGLFLGPALFGRSGRARLAGGAAVALTLVCIALSGTRGAWIGGAMLCAVAAAVRVWSMRGRTGAIVLTGVAALAIGAAGAAWLVAGSGMSARLSRGVDEVRAALRSGDYTTDTGMRLAMWRWALVEAKAHPVLGVGAGGFRPWAVAHPRPAGAMLPVPHAHAHSWYLHTLATLGGAGLVLLLVLVLAAVHAGWPRAEAPGPISGLAHGPPLALLGLACAGLFDTVTTGQQSAYLFYVLVALSLPSRPREAP